MLRIFMSNTDKFKYKPVYEVIVFAAKRYGLAGAIVLKGVIGYDASSAISSVKFWEVTEKLPIVVEILDESKKIEKFLETIKPYFDKIKNGCIITTEKVDLVFYKSGEK